MKPKSSTTVRLLGTLTLVAFSSVVNLPAATKPNIIVILADDLG
jgi:hypothetical protein